MSMITLKEIAELAGVSRGTVDRVLKNRAGVSKAVIDRVNAIAEHYGYTPNKLAQALVNRKKEYKIGVISSSSENIFFKDVAEGVRAAANVAAKSIARSHQNLLLWGTKGTAALCGTYPLPVWLKSQYKLQPVRPVRSALCPTIGRTELMWGAGNNPPSPGQADNFAYLLWRWRDCCAW